MVGAGEETADFVLLHCGVLGASTFARPCYAKLPVLRLWRITHGVCGSSARSQVKSPQKVGFLLGAGEETQTPGLFLGKEALYQLSYTRMSIKHIY